MGCGFSATTNRSEKKLLGWEWQVPTPSIGVQVRTFLRSAQLLLETSSVGKLMVFITNWFLPPFGIVPKIYLELAFLSLRAIIPGPPCWREQLSCTQSQLACCLFLRITTTCPTRSCRRGCSRTRARDHQLGETLFCYGICPLDDQMGPDFAGFLQGLQDVVLSLGLEIWMCSRADAIAVLNLCGLSTPDVDCIWAFLNTVYYFW